MALSQISLLCLVAALLVLLGCPPALCQTVVEDRICDSLRLGCGGPEKPVTKRYCCAERNGIYSCCNPYIGLTIGLCVGVPLVIGIIVAVVSVYCCCAHYQNRKMLALARTYARNRRYERAAEAERSSLAPPPYSTTDKLDTGSELPTYSISDPYTLPQPPAYEGGEQQQQQQQQEGSGQQQQREEDTAMEHTSETTTADQADLPQTSTVVEQEDVPLLSA